MSGAAIAAGFAGDLAFADPARWHPVAGFGRLALAFERVLHRPSRLAGAVFTALLVGGVVATVEGVARRGPGTRAALLAAATWASLGGRSLTREAIRIGVLLTSGNLAGARAALPALVGRDPQHLSHEEIARAVVESVAENTSDAVVGTLFWAGVAGPAGVAGFRAVNTLDAMVGHRNERYESFGWASARLDDVAGWLPARMGALATAVCAPLVGGSPRATWTTLRRDGSAHPSPNAGQMEAAFAGALGLTLGGRLAYGGRIEERPELGSGRRPAAGDIERAARLSIAVSCLCAVAATATRALIAGSRP